MITMSEVRALEGRANIVQPIIIGDRELSGCFQVDEVGPFEDGDRPGKYMERHAVLIGAWDDEGVMTVDYIVASVGLAAVRAWEEGVVQ